MRTETVGSPEALLDASRGTLAWLGDDELGPVFVEWVGEVLMPLRFPDSSLATRPPSGCRRFSTASRTLPCWLRWATR
ncbi:MAG: hypothetical protein OXU70_10120 [Gammaproteobacteria bacterium]|nr:hypothetical protein [Gammaproteobacteria bacterium]